VGQRENMKDEMGKAYTYEEMQALRLNESEVIKTTWFKHKSKPIYKKQLNIFTELNDFEEVA
jgi:hypothetical protein